MPGGRARPVIRGRKDCRCAAELAPIMRMKNANRWLTTRRVTVSTQTPMGVQAPSTIASAVIVTTQSRSRARQTTPSYHQPPLDSESRVREIMAHHSDPSTALFPHYVWVRRAHR